MNSKYLPLDQIMVSQFHKFKKFLPNLQKYSWKGINISLCLPISPSCIVQYLDKISINFDQFNKKNAFISNCYQSLIIFQLFTKIDVIKVMIYVGLGWATFVWPGLDSVLGLISAQATNFNLFWLILKYFSEGPSAAGSILNPESF